MNVYVSPLGPSGRLFFVDFLHSFVKSMTDVVPTVSNLKSMSVKFVDDLTSSCKKSSLVLGPRDFISVKDYKLGI